jgi:hypothetical protein
MEEGRRKGTITRRNRDRKETPEKERKLLFPIRCDG